MMYNLVANMHCPICGGVLIERTGVYGDFYGCTNYPECNHTLNITQEEVFMDKREKVIYFIAKLTQYKSLNDFFLSRTWKEDSELCMRLFSFQQTKEDIDYLKKILYNLHRRDKRTIIQYARDLMYGWIIEDCIIEYLQSFSWDITLSGGDKDRKFSEGNVICDPDFKIKINDKNIFIEQVSNYSGIWKNNQRIELRDDKYKKLMKYQSYILCIDFQNDSFYFLYTPQLDVTYINHLPAWGGKPAYSIDISSYKENNLTELNNILKQILM